MTLPLHDPFRQAELMGLRPEILGEIGDITEEDGLRITLFDHHLLVELNVPHRQGHLLIPITDILEALQARRES